MGAGLSSIFSIQSCGCGGVSEEIQDTLIAINTTAITIKALVEDLRVDASNTDAVIAELKGSVSSLVDTVQSLIPRMMDRVFDSFVTPSPRGSIDIQEVQD